MAHVLPRYTAEGIDKFLPDLEKQVNEAGSYELILDTLSIFKRLFKINDEKTIQVCDNICYEMYQLQQAMKTQDPTTVLAFVDEFFSQHEENSGAAAAAEDKVRRESQQQSRL